MGVHSLQAALELLVRWGSLSPRDLKRAEAEAQSEGVGVERFLVERSLLDRGKLLEALARVTGVPYFDLRTEKIRYGDAQLIPEAVCRQKKILAVGRNSGRLVLAMADPEDAFAMQQIEAVTGLECECRVIWEADLDEAITRAWSVKVERIDSSTPHGQAAAEARHAQAPQGKFGTATAGPRTDLRISYSTVGGPAQPRSLSLGSASSPAPARPVATNGQGTSPAPLLRDLCSPLEGGRLWRIAEAARTLCDAEFSALYLLSADESALELEERCGDGPPPCPIRLPLNEKSLPGYAMLHRCEVCTNRVQQDPRHSLELDAMMGWTPRSTLCTVISWESRPLGILQVVNRRTGELEARHADILRPLADQVALVVTAERASTAVRGALPEMTETLRLLAEAARGQTRGHGELVGRVAAAMGREMNLGPAETDQLRLAGYVHDLGKLFDEGDHPERGAQVLERVEVTRPLAAAVRHHHRRHDQLGDGIPLPARILAVAEAWVEALEELGPPRRAEAMARMMRDFGERFHPALKIPFEIAAANVTPG